MPVLNPHQQLSQLLTIEFLGRKMMKWNKVFQSFDVLKLKAESGDIELWMSDDHKLMRVAAPTDGTEAVRDLSPQSVGNVPAAQGAHK